MAKRKEPEAKPPDFPPERALPALKKQLIGLDKLKNRNYEEARQDENEWEYLTKSILIRTFGENSANLRNFYSARAAGVHSTMGSPLQSNFEKRIQGYEAVLKSSIAELELLVPETEIGGAYQPGEEYQFYRDLKALIELAASEILVVDPYLDSQLFDIYVERITPGVLVRVLSAKVDNSITTIAQKYSSRGNFELRENNDIHDRVLFVDDRCWVIGQSIKDAAKKKPTYIVEHDSVTMKPIYENIWSKAVSLVKG